MTRISSTWLGKLPMMIRGLGAVAVLVGGSVFVSAASASVTGTVLTGSSGTMTLSLSDVVFNTDSAAIGGGNSDVASGTNLKFAGCSGVLGSPGCLTLQEGVTINNADLTLSPPLSADANTFLTFAAHPNLVYSISWPPGPGSANTNCAATTGNNGDSCSLFPGSPLILTYENGDTFLGLSVHGKASDIGTGGLATASTYTGGFSEFLTAPLPNGMAPTPQNIQLYFCPTGTCEPGDYTSGKSITSSQSGTFTAIPDSRPLVPEPSTVVLSSIGMLMMMLVGTWLLKSSGTGA